MGNKVSTHTEEDKKMFLNKIKEFIDEDKNTYNYIVDMRKDQISNTNKKKSCLNQRSRLNEIIGTKHSVDAGFEVFSSLINATLNHEINSSLYKSTLIPKICDSDNMENFDNLLISSQITLLNEWINNLDNYKDENKPYKNYNKWLPLQQDIAFENLEENYSSIHGGEDLELSFEQNNFNGKMTSRKTSKKKLTKNSSMGLNNMNNENTNNEQVKTHRAHKSYNSSNNTPKKKNKMRVSSQTMSPNNKKRSMETKNERERERKISVNSILDIFTASPRKKILKNSDKVSMIIKLEDNIEKNNEKKLEFVINEPNKLKNEDNKYNSVKEIKTKKNIDLFNFQTFKPQITEMQKDNSKIVNISDCKSKEDELVNQKEMLIYQDKKKKTNSLFQKSKKWSQEKNDLSNVSYSDNKGVNYKLNKNKNDPLNSPPILSKEKKFADLIVRNVSPLYNRSSSDLIIEESEDEKDKNKKKKCKI